MSIETQDTIAAISTPSGRSFSAIIKISGTEAIQCIKNSFVPNSHIDLENMPTYTSVQGYINVLEEQINIPVLLYIMRQPYSYTKEDVVEIHTIGSPWILEMLLNSIFSKKPDTKRNIRISQPGEFTKRAFLHGRIDLTQAESTMRIIRAQTDSELKSAIMQLTGSISKQIKYVQDEAVSLCAHIEAAIDFSDQDIELISIVEITNRLETIKRTISDLLAQSETSKVYTDGINTILYGKPNVGKSSLINALLEKKRAVVSEIPGTTRDIIADTLDVSGIRFKLTDTAGIDETEDIVSSLAMERTKDTLKSAHVILIVFDDNTSINEQLREIKLENITGSIIVVINKCDLQKNDLPVELPVELRKYPVVRTSTTTGEGLEKLKKILLETVLGGQVNIYGSPSTFNTRQKEALLRSLQSILQTIESAKNDESYEFIALNLRTAVDALGEVVGEITTENILDKIFSGFCIGK